MSKPVQPEDDAELSDVAAALLRLDPDGTRTAQVLRDTFDQLYDGQRTGCYRWKDLYKTEKTHCGTLVEINLQREFDLEDGQHLDYRIAGVEVDCKYSQKLGDWMIPPEAKNRICLLVWGEDSAQPKWKLGLARINSAFLGKPNRDAKQRLNDEGKKAIYWLHDRSPLPPNVLLQLDQAAVDKIFSHKHGTKRVDELFRLAQCKRIGRATVATVAMQDDFMKRVRDNGGSRTALRPEGIIILGGQYRSHAAIARQLNVPAPRSGESVSVRVSRVPGGESAAGIAGGFWRVARSDDPAETAPKLPKF